MLKASCVEISRLSLVLGERNVSKIILIGNDNIYRGKNVLVLV